MITLEKYRDKWLAQNVDEFIGFYPREFFCFDNFSAFAFVYDGIRFHTVEHAYQAYKFKDTAPEIFNEIVNCFSSDEARRIAHRNEDKVVSNWHDIKVDLMEKFVRAKLDQNSFVKKKFRTQNFRKWTIFHFVAYFKLAMAILKVRDLL